MSAPVDYLVKDYAGFRRLILDRLAQAMPGWQERSPADVGVVLAELLAHAADTLSYYQDAVATEAYLGTARKRVSCTATSGCSTIACTKAATRGRGCALGLRRISNTRRARGC